MAKHPDPYRTADVFLVDAKLPNGKYSRAVLDHQGVPGSFEGQLPGVGI
jgi:hypothetical protein